ncbi:MAG: hypothetical protein E7308_04225 [Butyrivibrio sp.]|nr:hypothetical protein [Butyrivibrio sp.]
MPEKVNLLFRRAWKFLLRRYIFIPINLMLLFLAIALVYSVVSEEKSRMEHEEYLAKAPTDTSNQYNEYGLPSGQELSEDILYEIEGLYVYSDRVVASHVPENNNSAAFAKNISALKRSFGDAQNVVILPIPTRSMYEPAITGQMEVYQDYCNRLRNNVNNAVFSDCSEDIAQNGDRNLFYRTETTWTMPGAYYGYSSVAKELGITVYPREHFVTYQNNSFHGTLYSSLGQIEEEYPEIEEIRESYPEDPFYFCLSDDAVDYELVKSGSDDAIYKRPYVTFASPGTDSIVGSNIDYAILSGAGEGDLLLIADDCGKMMASYLAENYKNVVVFDITRYKGLGYKHVLSGYDIKDIVVAQTFDQIGNRSYSRFLNYLSE